MRSALIGLIGFIAAVPVWYMLTVLRIRREWDFMDVACLGAVALPFYGLWFYSAIERFGLWGALCVAIVFAGAALTSSKVPDEAVVLRVDDGSTVLQHTARAETVDSATARHLTAAT
jgi:hypothetical protein